MASVAVMMSVYNGEKYLAEQIESILSQQGVEVTIYIRDDGSDAPARSILQRYAADHQNIILSHGKNLGIKDSFLQIVRDVPLSHDYYAFSDADDVWLPEKLASAVALLDNHDPNAALAYCSQITLVDENLGFIGYGRPLIRPISFANAIVECRMSGATAVFNRTLMAIAQPLDYSYAVIHDAWMNLIAASFGQVHFDPASHILYRQHGANADGGMWSVSRTWRARLARASQVSRFARQGEAFLGQVKGKLSKDKEAALLRFVRYTRRDLSAVRFLFDPDLRYQRRISKILTAFSLLRSTW